MWPKLHAEESPVSCAWTQERLLGYLDGDLAPRETQRLRAHLDGCPACRREMALTQRSESLLASALSTAPPAGDLRAGFYARLADSSASPARRPARSLWTAVPALAGVLLAVWLLSHHPLSSRMAAVGPPPPLSLAAVPDSQRQDPAFPLAALQFPVEVESPSARRASGPHIAAKALRSLAWNSYRSSRRIQRNDTRREIQMAFAPSAERRRPLAEKAAGAPRWEAREKKSIVLASRKWTDSDESAKLVSAEDEVDFSVRDDVRGFTAGTHVSSLPAAPDGDHVVIIEEKSDSLPASADQGADSGF